MVIKAEDVKKLRETTGAGILDCKKALEESAGDFQKALDVIQIKSQAIVMKKAAREARDGKVASYIHGGGRIGVLVEVNCETDFVARTEQFEFLVKEICLQIAAMNPQYVGRDVISPEAIEKNREIFRAQALEQGKPEKIVDKIVEGRLEKWYAEVCLLEQAYIKDQEKTVLQLLNETIAKTGENIRIKRFTRYQLGE